MNAPPPYSTCNGPPCPVVMSLHPNQNSTAAQLVGTPVHVGQTYGYTAAASPAGRRVYENYCSRQSIFIGVTMVIGGIMCLIFNIVAIVYNSNTSVVGYGIWCGILFIIAGSYGVSAGKQRTGCKVTAFMVLCIISGVFSIVPICLGSTQASIAHHNCYYTYYDGYQTGYNLGCYLNVNMIIAMEAMQAIVAAIVGAAAIWGSTICCKVACCCTTTNQVLLPPQYLPLQGNPQIIFLTQQPDGQFIPYPAPVHFEYHMPSMRSTNSGVYTGLINSTDVPSSEVFTYNPQEASLLSLPPYATAPPSYDEGKETV